MIRDEDEREEYVRTRKYMNMYNNPILAVAQPQRWDLWVTTGRQIRW